ncbi:MAG TPA: hypothetical protein V6D12_00560 [Candidatus Obscuribacterales bacterium]
MESRNNSDAAHIGMVLLAGMCLAAGIALGAQGRDSDRLLISQQSNEIYQLKQQLMQAEARFQGYRDGRR